MSNMAGRLKRIERVIRPVKCPECGGPMTESGNAKVEVRWQTFDDPPMKSEYCPKCGRPLVIVLHWLDER